MRKLFIINKMRIEPSGALSSYFYLLNNSLTEINSNLSTSYQTIYNVSGRSIKIFRYGKLRILYIQNILASVNVHSLIPASDMPLGGSARGSLVYNHNNTYGGGDLYISSSNTQWIADTGVVSSDSYIYYGQLSWVVS